MASSYVIPVLGWTVSGVAAGSTAAGIQSGIGLVAAGSKFACLQSLGSLGFGVFGTAVVPVVLCTAVGVGVSYTVYKHWMGNQKILKD